MPRLIHSDTGREFCNSLQSQLCELYRINQKFCGIYRGAQNGKIERIHRFLGDQLRLLKGFRRVISKGWPVLLAEIVAKYNNGWCSAVNEAPYFIAFGKPMVLPSDADPQALLDGELARAQLDANVLAYRTQHFPVPADSMLADSHRFGPFAVGDVVWYVPPRKPGQKFLAYDRPCRIVEIEGRNIHDIEKLPGGRVRHVPGQHLRLCFGSDGDI